MSEQVFTPKVVLRVTVVEHRDISLGWLWDSVTDTPDPYITVTCPWLDKNNTYSTRVKEDQPTAKVNETFRFIIPEDKLAVKQLVEIKIMDDDLTYDDEVGEVRFDASSLKVGDKIFKTFVIKDNRGQVDVEFLKYKQKEPHFRLSEEICDEEKDILIKRMPKVKEAIHRVLGNHSPAFDLEQTPKISVVGSGGGYRAAIGMSGGMAALKDAGLLDALAYTSGLSGSSWYLCSAYAHDGVRNATQDKYHEWLKAQMEHSVYGKFLNPLFYKEYCDELQTFKHSLAQPTTTVDYYGYAVGSLLLGDKLNDTMLQVRESVKDGDVPYPILSSVHLKKDEASHKFHVHMENTPHEVSMPRYGLNIATKYFGSHWNEGVITRECPEFPLHYYIGCCGCAFSILLNTLYKFGNEVAPGFVREIEELRSEDPGSYAMTLAEESRLKKQTRAMAPRAVGQRSAMDAQEKAFSLLPFGIFDKVKEFFRDRTAVIDRTAEVKNFALNMQLPEVYPKPLQDISKCSEFQQEVIKKEGYRNDQGQMAQTEENISVCDSGIVKNVNCESFLRPSRFSDLIIVFDMNKYEDNDYFDYMPIIQSAEHAWRNGFPFPRVQLDRLVNEPPAEFLAFESDSDDCPTVLWFTLCNKTFKQIKDYKPKTPYDPSKNKGKAFTDFEVFGDDGQYPTYNFSYTNLEFEQLHELMYHNVTSCLPQIKAHIASAVERKKRREARNKMGKSQQKNVKA